MSPAGHACLCCAWSPYTRARTSPELGHQADCVVPAPPSPPAQGTRQRSGQPGKCGQKRLELHSKHVCLKHIRYAELHFGGPSLKRKARRHGGGRASPACLSETFPSAAKAGKASWPQRASIALIILAKPVATACLAWRLVVLAKASPDPGNNHQAKSSIGAADPPQPHHENTKLAERHVFWNKGPVQAGWLRSGWAPTGPSHGLQRGLPAQSLGAGGRATTTSARKGAGSPSRGNMQKAKSKPLAAFGCSRHGPVNCAFLDLQWHFFPPANSWDYEATRSGASRVREMPGILERIPDSLGKLQCKACLTALFCPATHERTIVSRDTLLSRALPVGFHGHPRPRRGTRPS